MKGITFDKQLGKWRARSSYADGNIRVGAYDSEKEAEEGLLQYYKDGLLPLQKKRST